MNLRVRPCRLQGAYIIEVPVSSDLRGTFLKVFERDVFAENGLFFDVQESFFSTSHQNVIRGIHFQSKAPQKKLVSVLRGAVRDVIVDLRAHSTTCGQWEAVLLSEENAHALYIPAGFGHAFVSLSDNTTMLYMCDGRYDAASDTGIRFDDPQLAIDFGIASKDAIVSGRDLGLMSYADYLKSPMEEI